MGKKRGRQMNKSIVLGLLLAMLVPTAAFADGHVSLGGDVRLRYEYSDSAGLDNGLSARTYINLGAKIDDNTHIYQSGSPRVRLHLVPRVELVTTLTSSSPIFRWRTWVQWQASSEAGRWTLDA